MTDDQLLRYSRHILLDDIGIEGQQRLLDAHALIIGAGGLGSPVALYLGSAGVGRITVVDPDTVDITNLQRQIAHRMDGVGRPKVDSLRAAIAALNPEVQIHALQSRADADLLRELVPQSDVVLDCSDNYRTRQAVNAACVAARRPLVSGAALRFDGQISVFDPRVPDAPCYACVFDPREQFEEALCSTMGVFAPLVGIIGAVQAAEALKILSGAGQPLNGKLLMLDGRRMSWDQLELRRNPDCPVCGPRAG